MTMKAAVLHAPGDLRVQEVPLPGNPGDEEVVVRVMAAGICGSDIGRVGVTGTYKFPTIPGHEFSGIIEGVGVNVRSVQVGDRVAVAPLMPCFACEQCKDGNYSLCDNYDFMGSRSDGGFVQLLKVPARNAVKIPNNIDFEAAATIESAAIILHGIQKTELGLGDPVVVMGCGALGFFAVQFAKLSGAQPVVAVDIDEEKLALAGQVGADICIYSQQEDAFTEIRAATGGRGAAYALECTGNDAGRDLAIRSTAKRGKVVLYGSAHGDVTFKGEVFESILRQEIEVIGSWNSYSVPFPGKEWFDIIELVKQNRLSLKPLVSHSYPLEKAPEIFAQLKERTFGSYHKILFKPNG